MTQTLSEDQFFALNQIFSEMQNGMLALNALPNLTVTFYGGAGVLKTQETYTQVFETAKFFATNGWGVISGGGPGVMAASIEGAKSGGGKSVAFRISLDNEIPLFTADIDLLFNHFTARKYALRQSDVLIYFPGGLGTLDELMENLTLMKTKKYPSKPIFLFDKSFWTGYIDWFDTILVQRGLVKKDFLELFTIVDTVEEIKQKLSLI